VDTLGSTGQAALAAGWKASVRFQGSNSSIRLTHVDYDGRIKVHKSLLQVFLRD
jgi:hypothetical protein